jgi:hypothetical protein
LLFWLSQEFLTKPSEISTRSSDSISIVFLVWSLRADWKNFPQKLDEVKNFMVFQIKNNQLTKNIVSGAAAIATLAGVGIAAAPAQAFVLHPSDLAIDFTSTDINGFQLGQNLTDWSITDIDDVDGSGILTGPIENWPGQGSLPDLSDPTLVGLPTVDFNAVAEIAPGIWEYQNAEDIVVTFRDVTVDGITSDLDYVIAADSTFDVISNGNINFNLAPASSGNVFLRFDNQITTGNGAFQFEQVRGEEESEGNGEFVSASVPEPASILGLLAVGGLGLSLKKRKKQN